MTSLKITANPDIERLLVAGRKAAYGELHVIAADRGIIVDGDTEAEYAGEGRLSINGVDLRPMISAVVLEVVVQIQHPEPRARPWWRFWA